MDQRPYVVTVHPLCPSCRPGGFQGEGECLCADAETQRAAINLDAARIVATRAMRACGVVEGSAGWTRALLTLGVGELGGTVETPDGSCITLRPTTRTAVLDRLGFRALGLPYLADDRWPWSTAEIVRAFNAAQGEWLRLPVGA